MNFLKQFACVAAVALLSGMVSPASAAAWINLVIQATNDDNGTISGVGVEGDLGIIGIDPSDLYLAEHKYLYSNSGIGFGPSGLKMQITGTATLPDGTTATSVTDKVR